MAEKIGVRRKAEKTAFGMKPRKLAPEITRTRQMMPVELDNGTSVMRRQWCFNLPALEKCREAFETAAGQKIEWGAGEDGQGGDGGNR
ncbi:MAG: hypothetical protein ACT4O2_06315 [Beijerinckiaceae bacterium]